MSRLKKGGPRHSVLQCTLQVSVISAQRWFVDVDDGVWDGAAVERSIGGAKQVDTCLCEWYLSQPFFEIDPFNGALFSSLFLFLCSPRPATILPHKASDFS